jgi:hypothetical protein
MGDEPRTILTCSDCKKTSVYNPADAHCFECSLKSAAEKLGWTEKKIHLTRCRVMAYHLLIVFLTFQIIGHYFDIKTEFVAVCTFGLGQIINPLTRWLARKF